MRRGGWGKKKEKKGDRGAGERQGERGEECGEEDDVEGKKATEGSGGGEEQEERGRVGGGGGRFTFDFKGDVPQGGCSSLLPACFYNRQFASQRFAVSACSTGA